MEKKKSLARIEAESSLMFGLKWSCVGFAIALCFLAGCSRLFDSGPPRYNTVEGPLRPPAMNSYTNAKQATTAKQMAMQKAGGQAPLYPGMVGVPQPQSAPMASGQMQAGQVTVPFTGVSTQQGQQPVMPVPSPPPPAPASQPAAAPYRGMTPQPMTQPYVQAQAKREDDSWFGGMFDWFGSNDEHATPYPAPMPPDVQHPVGYPPVTNAKQARAKAQPYGYPVPEDAAIAPARPVGSGLKSKSARMSNPPIVSPVSPSPAIVTSAPNQPNQAAAKTPDFMVSSPAPQPPVVPLPKAAAQSAGVASTPEPMQQKRQNQQPASASPATTAPQVSQTSTVPLAAGAAPNREAIQAQIAELQRELATSESQSNTLKAEQQKQAKEEGSWLPNLGISDMIGDDKTQPKSVTPGAVPANQNPAYKVVRLPPPTRNGAPAPTPQAPAEQQAAGAAPHTPVTASGNAIAPVPPVINEPTYDPMANAPVMQTNQPSIDVPLAPDVGSVRSAPSNIPQGLLPPETARAGGSGGYLSESRYSNHSAYQGFSH